ncbi:MAG: M23 family metallopeptidase [Anaerolineaceae bacterium]|nr:M23 family metallopeptidase [Anaerolineaceae bacterium]
MNSKKRIFFTILIILSFLFNGCNFNPPETINANVNLGNSNPEPVTHHNNEEIEASPVVSNYQEDTVSSENGTPEVPLRKTDTEILEINFPTPAPYPVSLWRPPLYDVPWALGPHDHFYFVRPIEADEINWPLANYRYGGVFFGPDIIHTGVDIPAPRGIPVYAAGKGEVVWDGYGLYLGENDPTDPYGLAVTIEHDFGYQGRKLYTVYAHLDRITVKIGEEVDIDTQVGNIGITGLTTGPHLHFEVRIEGNSFHKTLNPELWLSPPQGWGVLVGKLFNTNGSILTGQTIRVKNLHSGQKWEVISYGSPHIVNSDPYYNENMALSDLPAGEYEVTIDYLQNSFQKHLVILPGAITYFSFFGDAGFGPDEPGL